MSAPRERKDARSPAVLNCKTISGTVLRLVAIGIVEDTILGKKNNDPAQHSGIFFWRRYITVACGRTSLSLYISSYNAAYSS
jgi:hypothetical protein